MENEILNQTPGAILDNYVKSIIGNSISSGVVVTGLFVEGNNKPYAGSKYFFDFLQDKDSGLKVVLKIPTRLRKGLCEHQEYRFKCVLVNNPMVSNGNIQICFEVHQVIGREENQDLEAGPNIIGQLAGLFRQKAKMGYKDFDGAIQNKLRAGKHPAVLVVLGKNAIVDEDINTTLPGSNSRIRISYYRVNINDPLEVAKTLNRGIAKGRYFDVACITRGGGNNLKDLEEETLARAMVNSPIPIATAIGHASDEILIDCLADISFPTPTAFAGHLLKLEEDISHKSYNPVALAKQAGPKSIESDENIELPGLMRENKNESSKTTKKNKTISDFFWSIFIIGGCLVLALVILYAANPSLFGE